MNEYAGLESNIDIGEIDTRQYLFIKCEFPVVLGLYSSVDSEISKMWHKLLKVLFRGRFTKELRTVNVGNASCHSV